MAFLFLLVVFIIGIWQFKKKKTKLPRLEFPIDAIIRNFVLTKNDDVWVGYQLSSQVFPLNDIDFFKNYLQDGEGILGHDEYDYHFINIPRQFNLDTHIEETIRDLVKGECADLGKVYFEQAGKILKDEVQLNEYRTYLFVRFTTEMKVSDPIEYFQLLKHVFKKFIYRITGQRVPISSVLPTYETLEKELYTELSNYKPIERLSAQEIGQIYYYFFHRSEEKLPERQLTPMEICEGVISNEAGYIAIEQLNQTHYSTFLSQTDAPLAMYGSSFIQNLQDSLSFPIDTHIRLRFEHSKSDERKINKMAGRIYEQEKEYETVDGILDSDDVLNFGTERLMDVKDKLKRKEKRLCYSTVTLVVSASSKEELEERVKDIEFAIESTDFKFYRSVADQLTLFNQCLIGSTQRFRSYEQVATTGFVADYGLDLKKEVGNKKGFPLGRIVIAKKFKSAKEALALSSKLVWYYPNLTKKSIEGAEHTNGNTLIIGPPGKGKSVLVKYIFLWLMFLGQKILYIDPKNETQKFFLKALEKFGHIPEFVAMYERINFISLSSDESCRGMLDPLLFLPKEEAIQTAKNVLGMLGEVDTNRETASHKKTVIQDAIDVVYTMPGKHSLSQVIEEIRKSDKELAKLILGHSVGLGKILIGNEHSTPIRFDSQINVLGTQGIRIPTQKEIDSGRLNSEQLAGMAIMEVIMKFTYIFSTNKEEDAAIIYDEAKGYEDTAQGSYLIDDSLRKGRANNTDIYLVVQAFKDYDQEDKKELISYKFAFRPKQKEAREKLLSFFDMEVNSANLEMMEQLQTGTCLFQDHLGRNQPIAIDVLFDSRLLAVSSTENQDEKIQAMLENEKQR